jgi:regulator of RNase E activity RraA
LIAADSGSEALMTLNSEARNALENLSAATVSMVLYKKGLRNIWIRNARSLRAEQRRIVGEAFTMRFIPGREDLATPESLASPKSTRFAIEAMPPDCVAVVDCGGVTDAGVFGDILAARMMQRGVAALVTDGAIRDVDGVKKTGLPVWCSGVAAPPSVAHLTFVGWQDSVGCGGVAIIPNDVIVADQDGAVVIPSAMVEAVIGAGTETEALEDWVLREVNAGKRLPGLYPPDAESMARYQAQRTKGKTT